MNKADIKYYTSQIRTLLRQLEKAATLSDTEEIAREIEIVIGGLVGDIISGDQE